MKPALSTVLDTWCFSCCLGLSNFMVLSRHWKFAGLQRKLLIKFHELIPIPPYTLRDRQIQIPPGLFKGRQDPSLQTLVNAGLGYFRFGLKNPVWISPDTLLSPVT